MVILIACCLIPLPVMADVNGDGDLQALEFTRISQGGFGDPQNNYAWSVAEFKGDLYVGTGRNIPYLVSLGMKKRGQFHANMSYPFFTEPGGSPPPFLLHPNQSLPNKTDAIEWSNDMRAEIWRYHDGSWTRVHQANLFVNPMDGYTYPEGSGYRIMATFTDSGGVEAVYAGVGFSFSRTLVLKSVDGLVWERVNTASIPGTDTRAMASHNGKLYVGTADGIYASQNPDTITDSWEKVADFQVSALKSYNGYLYAGTGNPSGSAETNGFEVWRSICADPAGPDDWERVVSGGAGDAWNVMVATIQIFQGNLYVGSMNLPFAMGSDGLKGFDLIRVYPEDTWDLLVGNYNPEIPTVPRGPPMSGWPSGYANPFNLYAWSMEEYHGNFYLGSFDIFSLARYLGDIPGGYEMLIAGMESRDSSDLPSNVTSQENADISGFLDQFGLLEQAIDSGYIDESTFIPNIEFLAAEFGGGDMWMSSDGQYWVPVDLNGLGDPNNYGLRNMLATSDGLIIGTANPFEGCQIWIAKINDPPVANFTADPASGQPPLTVQFNDTSTGTMPLSYSWDFGDGSPQATVTNPVHIYNASESQVFDVMLTVTNSAGQSSKNGTVSVFVPVNTYTINATAGPNGTIDPSGIVELAEGANQTFTMIPAGHLNCWGGGTRYVVWNYSVDGQSVEMEPSIDPVYYSFIDVDENHTIHVNFEEIIIDVKPFANFAADPIEGMAPLPVNFSQVSVIQNTGLQWDFGDNSTSTEQNPTHTYLLPGTYDVSLTVFCDNLSFTNTEEGYISVSGFVPAGGDTGYFLIHSTDEGALVFFDDTLMGTIEDGTLLVEVYITGTPFQTYSVEKEGYLPFTAPITDYPAKDQTVDLYVELEPVPSWDVVLQDGWNTFSVPVQLENGHATFPEIFDETSQSHIDAILGWDGSWFIPSQNQLVIPLTAWFVKVNGSATATIYPYQGISAPFLRTLPEGMSFIGTSPSYENGTFPAMSVDAGLISLYETPSGTTGYLMVISPGVHQPGWAYARGGSSQEILPFKGYWVVMENPDTYYGFGTTPVG
ncbi:MAG TPA: PKD domain-containing protein [Methanoregulaceae archaeon]|nr:PKD domain-containing protein [Methanoregulaceae archaeon]